jgi:hypothetical protein
MHIIYRKDYPTTAKTWFAKMTRQDREQLERRLIDLLVYLGEKSINPNSDPWVSVSERSKSIWGWSSYESKPNNLVSVLAGAIDKLRRGGDLTDRQLEHVEKIGAVLDQLGDTRHTFTPITFEESDALPSSGNALEDLRQKLFDGL